MSDREECGMMGLCELRRGHEGRHKTSVDRALAGRTPAGLRDVVATVRQSVRFTARATGQDLTTDDLLTLLGGAAGVTLAPDTDRLRAVEAAFIEAVNAPSKVGTGIAVPYFRDVNAIWQVIATALAATPEPTPAPPALDVDVLARALCEDKAGPDPLWELLGEAGRDYWYDRAVAVAKEYRRLATTTEPQDARP